VRIFLINMGEEGRREEGQEGKRAGSEAKSIDLSFG
jgi:hypothetical protein